MPYEKEGKIKVTFQDGTEHEFTAVEKCAGLDPAEVVEVSEVEADLSLTSTMPVQNKTVTGALNDKADLENGKVPADQLPSYVDDVVEYPSLSDFPEEGETNKIYVALDTNLTYRWSGTDYIQIGGQDLSDYYTKQETIGVMNDILVYGKGNEYEDCYIVEGLATVRETLESLEDEFVENLLGSLPEEGDHFVPIMRDTFGRIYYGELTSENSMYVMATNPNLGYSNDYDYFEQQNPERSPVVTYSVSIETDTEDPQVVVGELLKPNDPFLTDILNSYFIPAAPSVRQTLYELPCDLLLQWFSPEVAEAPIIRDTFGRVYTIEPTSETTANVDIQNNSNFGVEPDENAACLQTFIEVVTDIETGDKYLEIDEFTVVDSYPVMPLDINKDWNAEGWQFNTKQQFLNYQDAEAVEHAMMSSALEYDEEGKVISAKPSKFSDAIGNKYVFIATTENAADVFIEWNRNLPWNAEECEGLGQESVEKWQVSIETDTEDPQAVWTRLSGTRYATIDEVAAKPVNIVQFYIPDGWDGDFETLFEAQDPYFMSDLIRNSFSDDMMTDSESVAYFDQLGNYYEFWATAENSADVHIKPNVSGQSEFDLPRTLSLIIISISLEFDAETGDGQVVVSEITHSCYATYQELERKQDILVSGETIKTLNNESLLGSGNISIQASPMTEVTYAELVALRNAGTLVPGMQYRITDFVTTTALAHTSSANHQFDVIVTADSTTALNVVARAALHAGDSYFANNKLNEWQIWYDIDNDVNRYDWADATNGKGVIFRMIDEFHNECPYDFKNLRMSYSTQSTTVSDVYTFKGTGGVDYSLNSACYDNVIKPYYVNSICHFPFISFNSREYGNTCYSNIIEENCHHMILYMQMTGLHIHRSCSNIYLSHCDGVLIGERCGTTTITGDTNRFGNPCRYVELGDANYEIGLVFVNNICIGHHNGNISISYAIDCVIGSHNENVRFGGYTTSVYARNLVVGNWNTEVHIGKGSKSIVIMDGCEQIIFGTDKNTLLQEVSDCIIHPNNKYVRILQSSGNTGLQKIEVLSGFKGTSSAYIDLTQTPNNTNWVSYRPTGTTEILV